MRGCGCVFLDKQGVVLEATATAANLLGRPVESLKNASWSGFFTPADQSAELPKSHLIVCANEGEYSVTASFSSPEGIKTVEMIYSLLKTSEGVGGYFVLLMDVSHQARYKKQAESLQALYEEYKARQEKFIAKLNHQLRSSLAVIALSVNTLKEYIDSLGAREREAEFSQIEQGLLRAQAALAQTCQLSEESVCEEESV